MPVGAIPAITGKLRKRLILDLSVALGGGTALGYAYWCVRAQARVLQEQRQ
jgi:cytochrome c oxidase subunit 7